MTFRGIYRIAASHTVLVNVSAYKLPVNRKETKKTYAHYCTLKKKLVN